MKKFLLLLMIISFNVYSNETYELYRCYEMLNKDQLTKSYCSSQCDPDQDKSTLAFDFSDKQNINAAFTNPRRNEVNIWNFNNCEFTDKNNWKCRNENYDEYKDSLFIQDHLMIDGSYYGNYSVGVKEDCILLESDVAVNKCFEANKTRDFTFQGQFSNCAFPIK